MPENFKPTDERSEIVTDFDAAQAALERVADKLVAEGKRERAHKVLGLAQSASAQRSLLALDWTEEDKREAA